MSVESLIVTDLIDQNVNEETKPIIDAYKSFQELVVKRKRSKESLLNMSEDDEDIIISKSKVHISSVFEYIKSDFLKDEQDETLNKVLSKLYILTEKDNILPHRIQESIRSFICMKGDLCLDLPFENFDSMSSLDKVKKANLISHYLKYFLTGGLYEKRIRKGTFYFIFVFLHNILNKLIDKLLVGDLKTYAQLPLLMIYITLIRETIEEIQLECLTLPAEDQNPLDETEISEIIELLKKMSQHIENVSVRTWRQFVWINKSLLEVQDFLKLIMKFFEKARSQIAKH